MRAHPIAAFLVLCLASGIALAADDFAPYGSSKAVKMNYQPAKLAYEFSSTPEAAAANLKQLVGVLKQAQKLQPAGSKIEVVVIGGGIGVFAKENYERFQAEMDEINEMHKPNARIPVEVAYCGSSINNSGYAISDFHGFGQVVPAGYLELDRLAKEGYSHAMIANVKAPGARYYFHPELKPKAQ